MVHSILIIGQSNMGGRGFVSEVEPLNNAGLFVLRNGRWRAMYRPVNPDRVTAGVNLAESFAEAYAREHGVDVGIIPCADGGTGLDQWAEGSLLFDHACYMAELASRTSTIAGVLWHQGESDCSPERYPYYEEKLIKILDAFKKRLNLYDVPFLLGGLGEFLYDFPGSTVFRNYVHVNAALRRVADSDPMYGFVPADGLGGNPDNMHFSAKALREFGLRYYKEFMLLERKDKVFVEKPIDGVKIQNELETL